MLSFLGRRDLDQSLLTAEMNLKSACVVIYSARRHVRNEILRFRALRAPQPMEPMTFQRLRSFDFQAVWFSMLEIAVKLPNEIAVSAYPSEVDRALVHLPAVKHDRTAIVACEG